MHGILECLERRSTIDLTYFQGHGRVRSHGSMPKLTSPNRRKQLDYLAARLISDVGMCDGEKEAGLMIWPMHK